LLEAKRELAPDSPVRCAALVAASVTCTGGGRSKDGGTISRGRNFGVSALETFSAKIRWRS
jgi:hypothetical protein